MKRGIPGRDKLRKIRLLNDLRRSFDPYMFLADVVGVTEVEERGPELTFSCPLPFGMHSGGDANPSAGFNTEKLVFNCFVCGGGDIIWLTQNVHGFEESEEAIRYLRQFIDPSDLSAQDLLKEWERLWREQPFEHFSMPHYNERIIQPWLCYSHYLDDRGISREVQRRFRTGLDLNNRDQVGGKDGPWIESPRVTLPHFYEGKLRGWQKRRLIEEIKPKYKNSPSFPRDSSLYNYDAVIDTGTVIVVESPLSLLRMCSEGIENVTATFGSEVTDEQVVLLRRFDHVVLFFDGDYGGQRATKTVLDRLMAHTNVWVIECPENHDPGNYRRKGLERLLDSKKSPVWR